MASLAVSEIHVKHYRSPRKTNNYSHLVCIHLLIFILCGHNFGLFYFGNTISTFNVLLLLYVVCEILYRELNLCITFVSIRKLHKKIENKSVSW